jgi:uncharacterized RDD family membrane protein YckC
MRVIAVELCHNRTRMSASHIQVPYGLTTEGLLGRRYMARCIDSVILMCVSYAVFSLEGAFFGPVKGLTQFLLTALTLPPIWIGYGTALESSPWQATVGKRVMGLRVYDAEGGRLSPPQAAARNLAKDGPFLLLGLVPGGRAFTWIWLVAHLVVIHRSPVCQAIHDRAAETWVAARESTTRLHLS